MSLNRGDVVDEEGRRDPVWDYAVHLRDGIWRCKLCGDENSGGAFGIKAHLGIIRVRDTSVCERVKRSRKRKPKTDTPANSSEGSNTTVECPVKVVRSGDDVPAYGGGGGDALDGFIGGDGDGNGGDSDSDVDLLPADDARDLAEKHCRDWYKRLEVIHLVRRGDTLVISGGIEGLHSLCSLSPPPAPEVRKVAIERCRTMKSLIGYGPTTISRLQNLTQVVIENCLNFVEIVSIFPSMAVDAPLLRIASLRVIGCPRMTVLLNPFSISLLQCLTAIRVHNCGGLESLLPLSGTKMVIQSCLSRLTSIEVAECPNLKLLLPSGWLQLLSNLQTLIVVDCERIENIIGEEAGEGGGKLPKLSGIVLNKLPALKSISKGVVGCDGLGLVEISGCPKLNRIPMLEGIASPLPTLKIKIDKDCWEKIEWRDLGTKIRFERFLVRASRFRY